MQDFLSTAQTLTRRAGDKATDTYGLASLPPPYYMESFLYANGARVLDEARTRCTLEAPEAVSTLQWWQDALWKMRVAPVAADGETAGIPSGQVGMWLMTPHSTPGHRQNNPFDWDIAPLPAGTKGKGSANSDFTYIVAKDTPAPAETWAFLVHMTGKAAQEVNAQEALLLPARKSALPAFGSPNQPPATARIFAESFKGSQAPSIYRTPLVIDLNTPYNALYSDSIVAQKVPLQDGIANTARAMNGLLQTYRQQARK
jgi:multiple sugar transport system substrate-binding protein